MKIYPFMSVVFVFVAWLTYERHKHSRDIENQTKEFWDREAEATSVRRVNTDTIEYITIPVKNLPFGACDDEKVKEYENILMDLSSKRILNLTGMTSTDINMKYGVANLETVSGYDDNFTLMVQTIASLGSRLAELDYVNEAIAFLEFGIVSLSDISTNYKLLCQLYTKTNQPERIDFLIETANKLNSLSKGTILRYLNDAKK